MLEEICNAFLAMATAHSPHGVLEADLSDRDSGEVREHLEEKIEEQAEIRLISDYCSNVQRVISTLTKRGKDGLSREAEQRIFELKSQMILFATETSDVGTSVPLDREERNTARGQLSHGGLIGGRAFRSRSCDGAVSEGTSNLSAVRPKGVPPPKMRGLTFSGHSTTAESSTDEEQTNRLEGGTGRKQNSLRQTGAERPTRLWRNPAYSSDDSCSDGSYVGGDEKGNGRRVHFQKKPLPRSPMDTIFASVHNTDSGPKRGWVPKGKQSKLTHMSPARRVRSSDDSLVDALRRLDTRVVPRPDSFDMSSGESIYDFFVKFETFCENSYRTHEDTWIGELGRCLDGELKGAFEALRGPNDRYRHLKEKLLRWYSDSREHCREETRSNFTTARRESLESLRLYAARLERLFRLAHPKRLAENSKVLREKFISTVPSQFRQQIEGAIGIAKMMTGETLSWSRIVTLVTHMDVKPVRESDPDNDHSMVWFGRSESPQTSDAARPDMKLNVKDAVSQCSFSGLDHVRFPHSRGNIRSSNNSYSRDFNSRRHDSKPMNSSFLDEEDSYCTYCQRVGHVIRNCRRRLGLCLVCGSDQHRVANCPGNVGASLLHSSHSAPEARGRSVHFEATQAVVHSPPRGPKRDAGRILTQNSSLNRHAPV